MASRGRGRRGRPRGTGQAPPVFDQQAFVEAVGIAVVAIAQASATGSQGGPSNLQMFRAHHHLIFTGGGDPMVADHWFMQVEKILEAMEITFDFTSEGPMNCFGQLPNKSTLEDCPTYLYCRFVLN